MSFKPQDLIRFIDLTSLNEGDTEESIARFSEKAFHPAGEVAALCIYPRFVKSASIFLQNKSVCLATVVNFPAGNQTLSEVRQDIQQALEEGAQEIDVVFPYQAFLKGQREEAITFIKACREACGAKTMKVILETGVLEDKEAIATATKDMVLAGADFIKTSTGKVPQGASLEAAQIILETLKPLSTKVGLKVSGGIREPQQALAYLELAQSLMGNSWPTPQTFRIGASQLIDKL